MNQQIAIPALPRPAKPPREKPTRSKGGCRNCKAKKKGCDQAKPTCARCDERGLECIYDPIEPRKSSRAPRLPPGGSTSDFGDLALQSTPGPLSDLEPRSASEATSAASSPSSMTFDLAPEPEPYLEYFRQRLGPLLVFRETGNPFVEQILPLSKDDGVLRNAFCLVAHVHQKQASNPDDSGETEFYSSVIHGLRDALKDNAGYQDSKLAVNVMLCYFEMIQSSSLSVSNLEIHLRGASKIILPRISAVSSVTVWLEKTIYFFDVLRSIAYGAKPMTTDHNLHAPARPQSRPMTMADVDPLFGLSVSLWPLLRRLALAGNLKRQLESHDTTNQPRRGQAQPAWNIQKSRQELDDQKREAWDGLRAWTPPLISTDPSAAYDRPQLESLVAHAEAYKAAALLHLLREIYEMPINSPEVQTRVQAAMRSCKIVLDSDGPSAGLVWPLFVASINTIEPAGINEAHAAFSNLYGKRQANNVLAAWRVCQETWKRRSIGIREVPWTQVATDLDIAVVFG